MRRFLRENWVWIVLPFVLVLAGMIAVLVLGGGDESVPDFQYPLY